MSTASYPLARQALYQHALTLLALLALIQPLALAAPSFWPAPATAASALLDQQRAAFPTLPQAPAAAGWAGAGSSAFPRLLHTATLLQNGKLLVMGGSTSDSLNANAGVELYDPATGSWSVAEQPSSSRYGHTATLLPSGKLLVVGGDRGAGSLASAELYDPATGTWSPTGSLATARQSHTATLLPSGKLLVVGGYGASSLASAELYDPASGAWSPVAGLAGARHWHTATLLPNGKLLVAGGVNSSAYLVDNGGGVLASAELYDPASNTWSSAGSLATARMYHTATLLQNGLVLVAGGHNGIALAGAELYDSATGLWSSTGGLATARNFHSASLLPSGSVLVTGGINGIALASAELYDPATGAWSGVGSLAGARYLHTATLLPGGQVFVANGFNASSVLASAELYSPAAGSWGSAGNLITARQNHTATLLPNGSVLIAGGLTNEHLPFDFSELYDSGSGVWSNTSSMAFGRAFHTATLLPNGKLLAIGGIMYPTTYNGPAVVAELYDPATRAWASISSTATTRAYHTATLLPNGKLLVVGGYYGNSSLASAQLYDPTTDTWSSAGSLSTARYAHTATLLPNGKVLVAAGVNSSAFLDSSGSGVLASAELYNPATNTWSSAGNLAAARVYHTATLLPNGQVLVAGGQNGSALASAELYNPATNTWDSAGDMIAGRLNHTATLLPSGQVLVAGGQNGSALASAELYDPATSTWSATGSLGWERSSHTAVLLPSGQVLADNGYDGRNSLASAELYDPTSATWSSIASVAAARMFHGATLLPDGKVLVVGGLTNGFRRLGRADLYDPTTNIWSSTSALGTARESHSTTLLPNGNVLVAGGTQSGAGLYLTSAEIYNWQTGTWSATGSLANGRSEHTATLLQSGKVLVVGGHNANASAELYDPATGSWSSAGILAAERYLHTATLLKNGKVLVAGGQNASVLASAELYDPVTNTWVSIVSMTRQRYGHTATLLPNGKVLVVGGYNSGSLTSAELYDPTTNTWASAGSLSTARAYSAATLLLDGKVLVMGGLAASSNLASAELYDPITNAWRSAGSLTIARALPSATLLPSGKVLVNGGIAANDTVPAIAELYDPELGLSDAWRPAISSAGMQGAALALGGTQFQGRSEAGSGGTNSSAGNYPLVQLRSLANEQVAYLLPGANWSGTSFVSAPVGGMPGGYALATVFANGIPSQSALVRLDAPPSLASFTAAGAEDAVLALHASDFTGHFADLEGGALAQVRISAPPAHGALKLGSTTLVTGSEVLAADLDTLTFAPDADWNGSTSFGWSASDGTSYPSARAVATLAIAAVNDAPSFTGGANPSVAEQAGAQRIGGWATTIRAGPADEGDQSLAFVVLANDNPGLFSAGPALEAATGALTFTPAPHASGTAHLSVALHDNGGTAGGGQDTSASYAFTITVGALNVAPTLGPLADLALLEDAPPQTIALSTISSGRAEESGQALSISAISSNPALIPAPSIGYASPGITGTLRFILAADLTGTATITVTIRDDGGTANGGVDTTTRTFLVTVSPVNDAPDFIPGANQAADSNAGERRVLGWASGFTPGPADETGQTALAYQVVSNSNPALFALAPTIDVAGTLTYTPQPGARGTATIGVRVRDSGGSANGGRDTSAVRRFTIRVTSPYRTYLPLI